MNCLLTMSMMGSILFLLLAFTEFFQPEMFSRKYRYRMIQTGLVFLIVPLPLFWENVQKILLDMDIWQRESFVYKGTEPMILYAQGEVYKNTAYLSDAFIRNICFGIAAVSFSYHISQYLASKKLVQNTFQPCFDAAILDLLQTQKKNRKIRRNVRIYTADFMISPFTIGIFKPIIIVPNFTDKSQLEMAICHELCHIKSCDGFVKFLYYVLRDLYWYQPIIYLIGDYLDQACELACDEQATRYMDKSERKKYGDLLIQIASEDFIRVNGFMDSLGGDQQTIKERIYFIMKGKRKESILAAFVSAGMIVCSVSTVFAYKPVNVLREPLCLDESFGTIEKGRTLIFSTEKDSPLFYDIGKETVVYDLQFQDTDGNIYPLKQESGERKICTHTYKQGELQDHVRKASGGCVIYIYAAKVCIKCGVASQKVLDHSASYSKCLH
ncbi:MAG: M56 family metallopeptidase [Eubacterium sp.]|nr:M56 family metallopeptidase [Eubacterium sp.]